jgi:putative salt-induced outer membrane protein
MLKSKALTVIVGFAAPSLVIAAPLPNGWSGDVGVGYIASNGNTKSSSANAKFSLIYTQGAWQNTLLGTALGTTADGESTGEQYDVSEKIAYNFTPRDYVLGNAEWTKDLKGPIAQRTVEAVGYGRHVLLGPVHTLDLEAGLGARQEIVNFTDERNNNLIGRFAGKYTWKISDTSAFNEALKIETGNSDTFTESITELKVNVVGNLFASASYTWRHNSTVPVGTGKTDTITALNLSYAFGAK